MTTLHDDIVALVNKHFAGQLGARAEQKMRAHIATCDACRRHYNDLLVVEAADPQGRGTEARLARSLGFSPVAVDAADSWWRAWIAPGVALSLAAAALLLLLPRGEVAEKGFAVRGAAEQAFVSAFVLPATGATALLGDSLASDERLAFAYQNSSRAPWKFLAIFAQADGGEIFWYYPAWTDAAQNPRSIAITGSGSRTELQEAIGHRLPGGRLTLFSVFSDTAFSVRQLEAFAAGGLQPGSIAAASNNGRPPQIRRRALRVD